MIKFGRADHDKPYTGSVTNCTVVDAQHIKRSLETTAKIAMNYELTSRDWQQIIDYFYGPGTFSNTNVTLELVLKCLQQTSVKSKELRDIENRSK